MGRKLVYTNLLRPRSVQLETAVTALLENDLHYSLMILSSLESGVFNENLYGEGDLHTSPSLGLLYEWGGRWYSPMMYRYAERCVWLQ